MSLSIRQTLERKRNDAKKNSEGYATQSRHSDALDALHTVKGRDALVALALATGDARSKQKLYRQESFLKASSGEVK